MIAVEVGDGQIADRLARYRLVDALDERFRHRGAAGTVVVRNLAE